MAESCWGCCSRLPAIPARSAAFLDVFESGVAQSALMVQVLLGVDWILPTRTRPASTRTVSVMAPSAWIPSTRTPLILLLSKLTRLVLAGCWPLACRLRLQEQGACQSRFDRKN